MLERGVGLSVACFHALPVLCIETLLLCCLDTALTQQGGFLTARRARRLVINHCLVRHAHARRSEATLFA